MTRRKRIDSSLEKLIVRLRDNDKLTYEQIGDRIGMGKSAIFKIYRRFKKGPVPEQRGRPRKTNER